MSKRTIGRISTISIVAIGLLSIYLVSSTKNSFVEAECDDQNSNCSAIGNLKADNGYAEAQVQDDNPDNGYQYNTYTNGTYPTMTTITIMAKNEKGEPITKEIKYINKEAAHTCPECISIDVPPALQSDGSTNSDYKPGITNYVNTHMFKTDGTLNLDDEIGKAAYDLAVDAGKCTDVYSCQDYYHEHPDEAGVVVEPDLMVKDKTTGEWQVGTGEESGIKGTGLIDATKKAINSGGRELEAAGVKHHQDGVGVVNMDAHCTTNKKKTCEETYAGTKAAECCDYSMGSQNWLCCMGQTNACPPGDVDPPSGDDDGDDEPTPPPDDNVEFKPYKEPKEIKPRDQPLPGGKDPNITCGGDNIEAEYYSFGELMMPTNCVPPVKWVEKVTYTISTPANVGTITAGKSFNWGSFSASSKIEHLPGDPQGFYDYKSNLQEMYDTAVENYKIAEFNYNAAKEPIDKAEDALEKADKALSEAESALTSAKNVTCNMDAKIEVDCPSDFENSKRCYQTNPEYTTCTSEKEKAIEAAEDAVEAAQKAKNNAQKVYDDAYDEYHDLVEQYKDAMVANQEMQKSKQAALQEFQKCEEAYNTAVENGYAASIKTEGVATQTTPTLTMNGKTQTAGSVTGLNKGSGSTGTSGNNSISTSNDFTIPAKVSNGSTGTLSTTITLDNGKTYPINCNVNTVNTIFCGDDCPTPPPECVGPHCHPPTPTTPTPSSGGINLIYRPISLTNPFPDASSSGGRRAALSIWASGSVVQKIITNNRGVADYEVYNLTPMYTITLTPSSIKDIRKYNDSHSYNDFNLDCKNGLYCESRFLKDYSGLIDQSRSCAFGDWYGCDNEALNKYKDNLLNRLR